MFTFPKAKENLNLMDKKINIVHFLNPVYIVQHIFQVTQLKKEASASVLK